MTLVEEIETGFTALENFYQQRSTYVTTGSGPENHEAIGANLNYENLVTYVQDASTRSGAFPVGVSSEVISEFSAMLREIDLASQSKSALYASIAAEATQDASIYAQSSVYNVSVVRGSPTSGPQV